MNPYLSTLLLISGLVILAGVIYWRRSDKIFKGKSISVDHGFREKNNLVDPVGTEFEDSISSLPDALILLGDRWQMRWANGTACEWFGIDPTRDQDRPIHAIMELPGFADYLSNADFTESFDCQAPRDCRIQVGIRIVPYREKQFLLQGRDTTEIRRLEAIRRDFVANASHELRTPVSILYGYLEMMQEEPEESISSQWKPAIGQMYEQTERIKQIIDDMMLLSRLEGVDVNLEQEFHPVAPLIQAAYKDAQALSASKGHEIVCTVDENYSLLCDLEEMRSLITNLISNAVRYTPDGGTITIEWKVDLVGGYLSVTDTGMGIEEANLPRLTERFYRTDPARSRAAGGTGLGLAIVNHIVNRHQAKMVITSKVGKGSTFMVHFPTSSIRADHDQVNLLLN